MKIQKIVCILFVISLLTGCEDGLEKYTPVERDNNPDTEEPDSILYHERAKEIFDLIQLYYQDNSTGLYRENYPVQIEDNTYSYLWPYDGLVSGAILLTQLGYDVGLAAFMENFEKYWQDGNEYSDVGGYGSATNGISGEGDRFYDDNSIVGISLVEAFQVTGNRNYLDRASRIVPFLQSGIDDVLGGGLWWCESSKNITGDENSNKPLCANGYATQFLLAYYEVCDETEKATVLQMAQQLYEWLKTNLKDTDHCYWNDMNDQGSINTTKWTYNTGVMIQNGVSLYNITKDQIYLTDAKNSAQGAYNYFVKTRNGLALAYPETDPWFNGKLLKGFIDLYPLYTIVERYIDAYIEFIDYGYENARTNTGLFYEDWTGVNEGRCAQLLMQDAVVESYGLIAIYKNEAVE